MTLDYRNGMTKTISTKLLTAGTAVTAMAMGIVAKLCGAEISGWYIFRRRFMNQ